MLQIFTNKKNIALMAFALMCTMALSLIHI